MLDLKTEKMTYEELVQRAGELERKIYKIKQAEETFRRQNESLTALHETSIGLIDHLDKEELLETILQRATKLTGTEHGYIYLHEPGEDEIQMQVGMGFFKSQLGRRVKKGVGMGGKVWESGQPVVVADYRSWQGRISDKSLDDLHSIVGIPLKDRKRFHGVIGLGSVEPGRGFKQEDIAILDRFAGLALVALDKAKLYADVRRELAERKRTETKKVIGKMLSGKKIQLFETKRLTRDGRVLDVQISSTLYLNRNGEPAGNIVTLRDISAQKKAG